MFYAEALTLFKGQLNALYTENECLQLLAILTDVSIHQIIKSPNQLLTDEQEALVMRAIPALLSHQPVQYIKGEAHFYGLDFFVSQDVLIPRPETEELVNWCLNSLSKDAALQIIDIGTGSGCIPITLSSKLKNARVYGVDISDAALAMAQKNASRHEVDVEFFKLDILRDHLPGKYDVIISNPPYVMEKESAEMEPQVLNFEPHLALFVPNHEALMFYERIVYLASQCLRPEGLLFFEINAQFGEETAMLLKNVGFSDVTLQKDMQGKNRFVKGAWMPNS